MEYGLDRKRDVKRSEKRKREILAVDEMIAEA